MSYEDFYNDFVDDAWEDFREYASPKLKSVLREIGILGETLHEPFFHEDQPLPLPSSRYSRVMSKLTHLIKGIKEVIHETQIDTTQYGQYSLQQPVHQGGNSGHQQISQHRGATPTQYQTFSGNQQTPDCSLCNMDTFPHNTHHCNIFTTPHEKRFQLEELEKCPDCTRDWHTHHQCPSYLSCTFHPDERHYTWLCPGHTATGPL